MSDNDRLQRIKAQIEADEYHIPSEQIADGILRHLRPRAQQRFIPIAEAWPLPVERCSRHHCEFDNIEGCPDCNVERQALYMATLRSANARLLRPEEAAEAAPPSPTGPPLYEIQDMPPGEVVYWNPNEAYHPREIEDRAGYQAARMAPVVSARFWIGVRNALGILGFCLLMGWIFYEMLFPR